MQFVRLSPRHHRAKTSIPVELNGEVKATEVLINLKALPGGDHRWSFEVISAEGVTFNTELIGLYASNASTYQGALEKARHVARTGLAFTPQGWWFRDPPSDAESLTDLSGTPSREEILLAAQALADAASKSAHAETLRRVAVWLENLPGLV